MRRQELHCWNCGEDGHGIYFCPQPRRYAGNNQGRGQARQVTPPRDRPTTPAPPPPSVMQPQVLRRPPQPVAEIPPLPKETDERTDNVIQLESKGKEKVMEPEIIAVKRAAAKKARFSKEVAGPPSSMDTKEEAPPSVLSGRRGPAPEGKLPSRIFSWARRKNPMT